MSELEQKIATALKHRLTNGRHLHHRDCIHNLPPEEQIDIRRRRWTREQYIELVGMPVQITPDEWECESPFSEPGGSGR